MPVFTPDREADERDGVVCIRDAFDASWLNFLAGAVEEAMVTPGPHAEEYTPKDGAGNPIIAVRGSPSPLTSDA